MKFDFWKMLTGMWLLLFVLQLALIGGVIWVAIHFISKYW